MQMLRYAEEGSIRFLHVSATNPAVSLPELRRIRSVLSQERLFLVVQDIFLTETAQLADVVLPAATWGEKTGTFTNVDRTVHLSEKAVEPPGQARPDLDILVELSQRMSLTDRDGQPLVKWSTAEEAFEAWKECSKGRPCDYSAMSYDKLRGGSGIQWPCTEDAPEGTERIYADGQFWSAPDYCETYGRDLVTGAPLEPMEYQALNPDAKAVIKAAEYLPPHEPPSPEFPYALITGRTLYHFHTRTKTGRAPQLQAAAPDVWVEVSLADADRNHWHEGDVLRIVTPRGEVVAPLRISGIREGVLFLPFHYGYWDTPGGHEPVEHGRAANELTLTDWDPASKQPIFKTAAAMASLLEHRDTVSPAPTTTGSRPAVQDPRIRDTHGEPVIHETIGGTR
ncbi:MAG: molybdopterin oxidoreductase family protein [Marmoricola sp.]